VLSLCPQASSAQDKAPPVEAAPIEADFKMLGMVGLAFWPGVASLTCGGPRVAAVFGELEVAFSLFPSVLYVGALERAKVRPTLGTGLSVSYGSVVLFAPVYYANDEYHLLVGLGYRF
jgi:hypothetical protein